MRIAAGKLLLRADCRSHDSRSRLICPSAAWYRGGVDAAKNTAAQYAVSATGMVISAARLFP
jgi:hypothetical protein